MLKKCLRRYRQIFRLWKNWHKTSAKSKFLSKFKKELKGDTNADFYIDKSTKEVFLKSNKSENG